MKIVHVIGARPNFMKVAPIMRAMARYPDEFEQVLVHTGQHYDAQMSEVFLEELDIPQPSVNLGVGSGSHADQTARIMSAFEPVLLEQGPDWVFVVGDVNSTLACALTAAKMGIKVAHVEAGLRSFDRTMPEEYNRLLTDQMADLLFSPSRDADENLLREGVDEGQIHFVGNVMIDTLVRLLPRARGLLDGAATERFVLVTLHRPTNVDEQDRLSEIVSALEEIAREVRVTFPIHPRTRSRLTAIGLGRLLDGDRRLRFIEPLGYLDFLALESRAALVVTDSGGVQEETTFLGVPCLTVRPNTERPVTVTQGTNRLVSSDREHLLKAMRESLADSTGPSTGRKPPELWDGHAAERIVDIMRSLEPTARVSRPRLSSERSPRGPRTPQELKTGA